MTHLPVEMEIVLRCPGDDHIVVSVTTGAVSVSRGKVILQDLEISPPLESQIRELTEEVARIFHIGG
jgi:tetrahydromethanopterin S-methyltransferase subunit B